MSGSTLELLDQAFTLFQGNASTKKASRSASHSVAVTVPLKEMVKSCFPSAGGTTDVHIQIQKSCRSLINRHTSVVERIIDHPIRSSNALLMHRRPEARV